MSKSLVAFLFLAAACYAQPARTVLDSVFTEAQATRGEAAYTANCAKCHEGADVDGPSLTGDPFIDRWREDTLASLFNFIKSRMPRDNPGKLGEALYRDILAFLLEANDYPAGAKELSAEMLPTTLLVGKDGPRPLPTNALVLAVGCLTPGAANSWMLTNATEPARTREADKTNPEELKNSAGRPTGAQTFRLQNLADLRSGLSPDTWKGRKVQVKGALVRQSGNDRINVTSLESVASSCTP
jgi:mono/diheme cytochrome c family protein